MSLARRFFHTKRSIIASDVLSEINKVKCINTLKSMKPIDVRDDKSKKVRNAAVLVPLCKVNDELSMMYTIRSLLVKLNRGQVSFPGGMAEEKDENLEMTALREAHEEIGIHPGSVDIWCRGPMIGRQDLLITPVVGYIGDIEVEKLNINYDEVESVFCLPINHFLQPENCLSTQFRVVNHLTSYKMPVFMGGKARVWGLTALITHITLRALVPHHYINPLTGRRIPSSP